MYRHFSKGQSKSTLKFGQEDEEFRRMAAQAVEEAQAASIVFEMRSCSKAPETEIGRCFIFLMGSKRSTCCT